MQIDWIRFCVFVGLLCGEGGGAQKQSHNPPGRGISVVMCVDVFDFSWCVV